MDNIGNNENNNQQNQSSDVQSYVYPYHDRVPSGSPGQEPQPPKKKDKTKVIGFVAWVSALVVLFSALSGGLVYSYMQNQLIPADATSETNAETTTTEAVEPTTEAENSQNSDQSGDSELRDRHFSLESAASRSDSEGELLSIIEIAEQGKPAVVAITTQMTITDLFGQVNSVPAAGSGFIVSDDGYIVTNNHVIEQAESITIVLENGDLYEADLVGRDPQNDLAVLKIDGQNLPTVILGDSSDILVGEIAVAIGNPLGEFSGTVTAGIISGLDREITIDGQTLNLLQTDAAINQGNSGGALFNSYGEVIGINTAKSAGAGIEGLGFAIPINHAKPVIESIIQNGYVTGRPKIGISTQDITEQMAEYYEIVEGVYIVEVERGSAADKAGLKRGDIIIKTNGQKTLVTSKINEIKNQNEPGDEMILTIVRDDREIDVSVILDEEVPFEVIPATSMPSTPADQKEGYSI